MEAATEATSHPAVGDPVRNSGHERLAGAVFGPLRPPTFAGWKRIVLVSALIVAGTLISLFRTPLRVWNVLWAEDGAVFVSDALRHGAVAIVDGYAGYMHFVPRGAAQLAVLVPVPVIPLAVTLLAAIITSLIACACFVFMEARVAAVELRFACWIACLALPIMGGEVANNLANLHWYLLIAAFCAVAVRARSTAVVVLQSVTLFCAVASDALALMLLPFVLFRWWVYLERRDRVPSLAYVAGALLQVAVVVASLMGGEGRPGSRGRPGVSELLDHYTYRVVLNALFGVTAPADLIGMFGAALPGVALAAVVAALLCAAIVDPSRRVGIAVFGVSSFVFAAVVAILQWDGFARGFLLEMFTGGRYVVVPVSLLLLALFQAGDVAVSRLRRTWLRRAVGIAILVAVLIPVVSDYRASNLRADAASWHNALRTAAVNCQGDPSEADGNVEIAPSWFGGMLFPCDRLTPFAP